MVENPKLFIDCECHSEGLQVEYDKESDEFYFAFWHQGFDRKLDWKSRIRWCWKIIITGVPWSDLVIVNPKSSVKIKNFIIKYLT